MADDDINDEIDSIMAGDEGDRPEQAKDGLNFRTAAARQKALDKILAGRRDLGVGVRRQYALGFEKVKLAPGERRELVQQTAIPFHIERIIIPRSNRPDPKWWRLQCFFSALWTNFLFSVPIILNLIKYGEKMWRPFYVRPPDERFLVNIEVGGNPQFFVENEGVPASVFDPDGIGLALQLETVMPGKPIKLIVENRSKRETDFVCGLIGTCDQT